MTRLPVLLVQKETKRLLCFLGYLGVNSGSITMSCPDFAIKMYLMLPTSSKGGFGGYLET